jgi:hypothetical protein
MLKFLSCLAIAVAAFAAGDELPGGDLPREDLHVHIHGDSEAAKSMTPAEAAALSKKLGVRFGILGEGGCNGEIHDNQALRAFIDGLEGQPVWRGMQVYGFDWNQCLSRENLARLDYIAADALILPQPDGTAIRIWRPGVHFDDEREFMERYIQHNLRVLSQR